MKTCVWYDAAEKIPPRKGYYLAFKGMTMGDDETATDYYYWDPKQAEWRDYESTNMGHYANVVYWTNADPARWYKNFGIRRRDEITAAEKDAWAAVEAAVERYEMVKALTKT